MTVFSHDFPPGFGRAFGIYGMDLYPETSGKVSDLTHLADQWHSCAGKQNTLNADSQQTVIQNYEEPHTHSKHCDAVLQLVRKLQDASTCMRTCNKERSYVTLGMHTYYSSKNEKERRL